MEQLSGVDASFLNMETNSVFGHVSSLYVFDPAGVPGGAGFDAMRRPETLAPVEWIALATAASRA